MAQIQVTVVEARDLKKMDLFSQSDSFVEVYLDDKIQKQKTKVIHNSKNPTWNEVVVLYDLFFDIIKYSIYFSNHFEGQDILHVDVFDEDTFTNDKIGSFTIGLHGLYEKRISH
jgi:Ca2+-dependent lipid-binding protein